MSIENHPAAKPLTPSPSPNWGELCAKGQTVVVVRFVLEESTVTIPISFFRRWEHTRPPAETLTIDTGSERIIIEGSDLAEVRAAIDLGRLCELRVNVSKKAGARPGPQIRGITIESA